MGKIANLIDAGMSIDNQAKARKLDAEFTDLVKKVVFLEAQVQHLEAEVNPLKREMVQLKEKIVHLSSQPKLTFNQRTGTYSDPSGVHYCAKCAGEGKHHPLKNEAYGWRCAVCTGYFSDPSRPEPDWPTSHVGDEHAGY